jgi:hypothetical protein
VDAVNPPALLLQELVDMGRITRGSILGSWMVVPVGFLIGFGVTFLPPKPSNREYVRTHPPSMMERCVFGLIGGVVVGPLMALRSGWGKRDLE